MKLVDPPLDYLSFDAVAREYDQSRFLPPEAQQQAARLLRDLFALQPGQVALDAGVGTGRFALPLAHAGVPVIGVDISEQMLGQMKVKYAALEGDRAAGNPLLLRLTRGDLRRLPIRPGVVGAALMVHILHLIADWRIVLEEVRRTLVPGGALFLAQESGRSAPTRDHYFALARARNVLRINVGATNAEEVHIHLQRQGATIERMDANRVRWISRLPIQETLAMLRRRTWSSLWTVPDADHAEMLAQTEAWARQTYGSLEAVEESEAALAIWAVRWP